MAKLTPQEHTTLSAATGARGGEPLPRGTSVGRYICMKLVGAGGVGMVYAAYDPQLDRTVAVKLLHPDLQRDSSSKGQARLVREAQAMAQLRHPNVVAVYDVGAWREQVFLAMEYVEGQTLDRWVTSRERSWREVLAMYLQAGEGLAAAHRAGMVHRDFKPENVLVGKDGRARVTDFGLARLTSLDSGLAAESGPPLPARTLTPDELLKQLTLTDQILGTLAYMAPEQMKGASPDPRSDEFSFCLALYQALFGERPYGPDPAKLLLGSEPWGEVRPPPRGARVPLGVRRALLRGLALDPKARFPTMEALLRALSRDPARTARRAGLALAAAALVVAAVAVGRQLERRRLEVCRGAEQKLVGVWDESRRRAVHEAFAATGKPYAEDAFRAASAALDGYAASWVKLHTETCEATWLRGEQSQVVLDGRMACLGRRLQEVQALADVLARADGGAVARALPAVDGLTPVAACARVGAAGAPASPAAREVRRKLDRAKAMNHLDREGLAQGKELAAEALAGARALKEPMLEAEALLYLGQLLSNLRQTGEGEQVLYEAIAAAQATGQDELAADGLLSLTLVVGSHQLRFAQAYRLGNVALGALQRIGSPPAEEARLYQYLGTIRTREGKYEQALEDLRRCLDIRLRHFGPEHLQTAISYVALSNLYGDRGQSAEALRYLELALPIMEKVLGKNHFDLVVPLNNTCWELENQGRYREAEPYCARALAVAEANELPHGPLSGLINSLATLLAAQGRHREALDRFQQALAHNERANGAGHPATVVDLLGIGAAQLALGQAPRAVATLERALQIRVEREPVPAKLAEARLALARALWEVPRGRPRATALVLQAKRELAGGSKLEEKLLAEADAWLAQHGASRSPRR